MLFFWSIKISNSIKNGIQQFCRWMFFSDDIETKDFTAKLNDYFETFVEVPRTKVGQRQTIETLISKEALLFAKYLRNEKRDWSYCF